MLGIVCWAFLIAVVVFFVVRQKMGEKKYKDADLSVDENWYEKSKAMYKEDDTVYQYYMHPDQNYDHQGHVVVNRDDQVIYEEKMLYASVTKEYEIDLVNHVLNYTHHHKMGHPVSLDLGSEDRGYYTLTSTYDFDGVSIWDQIRDMGYSYDFKLDLPGFKVKVSYHGEQVGTIYTSNQGKNFYHANGSIQSQLGGKGYLILEGKNKDLDALVLLALAISRTEFSLMNIKG